MNPMRTILLAMAGSARWERLLTGWSVTQRVVRRFVPGEDLDAAVDAAREINVAGMSATLNPLGENVNTEQEAAAAAATYVEILERIAAEGLDANVSVKLTLLGLDLGPAVAKRNLRRVLDAAARHDNFVGIDMEASDYVDPTLVLHRALRSEYPRLGVVIQSYLRRSAGDVDRLAVEGAAVRLVKGAYNEPPEIAFPDKNDVDREFVRLTERLAQEDARAAGARVAIASHDAALLDRGRELIDRLGLDSWEFQMLYGIGTDLQASLTADGYPVRIYISYGPSWYPWFMRRLAERPANVGFFLRHLFG